MTFDSTDYSTDIDVTSRVGRLNHLITVLRTVSSDRFNMNSWRCGTSACAAGWATKDPLFKAQGFRYSIRNCDITYHSSVGIKACSEFFQIPIHHALYLFSPLSYAHGRRLPPLDVIAHIQAVLLHPCD